MSELTVVYLHCIANGVSPWIRTRNCKEKSLMQFYTLTCYYKNQSLLSFLIFIAETRSYVRVADAISHFFNLMLLMHNHLSEYGRLYIRKFFHSQEHTNCIPYLKYLLQPIFITSPFATAALTENIQMSLGFGLYIVQNPFPR